MNDLLKDSWQTSGNVWGEFGNVWHTFDHVETHINLNFSVLIGIFVVLNLSYYLLDWYFSSFYTDLYNKLPFHRKRYIIKNVLKSIYLGLLTPYASWAIIGFIVTGDWSNYFIHNLGYMYMVPDLISLFRVPNLHRATVQHHVTVVILTTLNLFCDYSTDTYWRGMAIYAYMSILTGIVNFYLGFRLLTRDRTLKRTVAQFAFVNYLISIIINWSYQLYTICKWVFTVYPLWGMYVYMGLIYFVVVDDIILLSFLNHAMRPRSMKSKWKSVMAELRQETPVKKDISLEKGWCAVMRDIEEYDFNDLSKSSDSYLGKSSDSYLSKSSDSYLGKSSDSHLSKSLDSSPGLSEMSN